MTDEKIPDLPDLDELPELPDPEHIPELPDEFLVEEAASAPQPAPAPPAPAPLESVPEPSKAEVPPAAPAALTPEPETPAAAPPTAEAAPDSAAAGAAPATPAGEKPPLRVLDKAPAHLRKASMIAVAGSLLPWMGSGGGWMSALLAKLVAILGVWFWLQQVNHNWGPQLKGFLGKMGDLELVKKKEDEKKKRNSRAAAQAAPSYLAHHFPTGLHILSLLGMILACIVLPLLDSGEGYNPGVAMAEIGMLVWAAYTFVHIHAYERWGHFNPLFPLMFLAMLAGGFLGAAQFLLGFGLGDGAGGLQKISGIVGGLLVGISGGLAAWTIVEAMMQAKKEGDIKKQAAIEARREARKSRRSGS